MSGVPRQAKVLLDQKEKLSALKVFLKAQPHEQETELAPRECWSESGSGWRAQGQAPREGDLQTTHDSADRRSASFHSRSVEQYSAEKC